METLDTFEETNIDEFRGYELLLQLMAERADFKQLILDGMMSKKVRLFQQEEWEKIKRQNYAPRDTRATNFFEKFYYGYNIGDCTATSKQLSYSYHNVDLVGGYVPLLANTKNAGPRGEHCWMESRDAIYDTSLLLVIDKSLKQEFGYCEECRLTASALRQSSIYQARKEFVRDHGLRTR